MGSKESDSVETFVKPDGVIEIAIGDAILPPGKRGLQANTYRTWYRVNQGTWKRSSLRSSMETCRAAALFDTVNDFEEYVSE